MSAFLFEKPQLGRLIQALKDRGYQVIGPKVDQNAIVYEEIESVDELPKGWSDVQRPGIYSISKSNENEYFGFNVGPHSWKKFLFPPRVTVATAARTSNGWEFNTPEVEVPKMAFLGVRACELAAIRIQDRVFLEGPYVDPVYKARRKAAFVVAVNCTQAAATCFCTSMDTGPECRSGYDLALTETENGFVGQAGTPLGEEVLQSIQIRGASHEEIQTASQLRQRAVDQITKQMPQEGIRDLLLGNLDHPRWDQVAERCLSCSNCTMVCPTCFCSTVQEIADLTGETAQRERSWDSCFNVDMSYVAGGVVRNDRRSRYRQWLTHKFASWHDQFDTSGCVGCGRCITWCPVGIDVTEEVSAIRATPSSKRTLPIVRSPENPVCRIAREPS